MTDAPGSVPAYLRPDGPAVCGCGQSVQQPWRTRDAAFSPASFIGGLFWIALGIGALLGCGTTFGSALLAVLALLTVGATALQARRGHRGLCLVRRGAWFGIAVAGTPVRLVFAFGV
ncbi:hypothetical protein ACI2LF_26120 [Kribbella sp. NPDC020789]